MSGNWKIHFADTDKMIEAMKAYEGNVEEAINSVLHGYAGEAIENAIYPLIPRSGVKPWKGKATPARDSKSLMTVNENLSVTVKSAKRYQYLYFPDDGSNTRRHVGNQQFFARGAEAVENDIINRCILTLTNNFEQGE